MIVDNISMFVMGIVAGLIASVPLGPIGVLVVQRTLSTSRRAGFATGLGAASADTIFAVLAMFSLSWVSGFFDANHILVTTIGGIMVVVFGLTIFYKKVKRPKRGVVSNNLARNFLSVFFLTLPNPAYFFIFVTIFTAMGITSIDQSLAVRVVLLLGVFVGASFWWFSLTWLVSKLRAKFTIRKLWWLNKITGGAIVILGAFAIINVVLTLMGVKF